MKKIILFFVLLVLTVINGIGQNVFYYASSGDKINLIADSTIQCIKVVENNDFLSFLQELEDVADGGDAISVMDVSSLPNGIYLLRAVTDSGVETGRFVKN